jgi:hypothetical protein
MSFYMGFCHSDRVEVLTDTAMYYEDSTLHSTAEKIHRIPGYDAIITSRGEVAFGERFATLIDYVFAQHQTYDSAIADFEARLPEIARDGAPPLDLMIAGISASRGPITHIFTTLALEDLKPWTLYTSTRGFMCANELEAGTHAGIAEKRVSIRDAGIQMMNWMRQAERQSMHTGEPVYFIGGGIDLTTVSRAGVTTERIHQWADLPGKKLEPSETNVVGLNRKQRRAARKAA